MSFQNIPGSNIVGLTAYTPTFTAFGTCTNVNFVYMKIFNMLFIQGKFTTGTTTGSEARISLPSGYTVASTVPTIMGVGSWTGFGANSGSQLMMLAEPGATYITLGVQDSSHTGFTKATGTGSLNNTATTAIQAWIPIVGDASVG